jgi:hypothetical protein
VVPKSKMVHDAIETEIQHCANCQPRLPLHHLQCPSPHDWKKWAGLSNRGQSEHNCAAFLFRGKC